MNPTKTKKKKADEAVHSKISTAKSDATAPAVMPRIRRDETNAKLSYANFFNVSSTREETALMFGMIQASANPREEVVVQVSDRVVITPLAAKRLQTMLGRVLDEYEFRFGPLTSDSSSK